ncbi:MULTISPECIES: hypothetical protein [Pseudoalteromonas]|uniref:Pyridoxamine 5'-phosphate oxidase putative domain-containing protein n=1 Tax=Pseudoalteromonas amylolytica TaxID=1859457 RepID=A0A1S1MUJ7_9GAMM|nr:MULTISPECIES: hypothetical protein [Pseudoalteromonas]OHU85173.1 hypothetical protein BFC16_20445 [Pseudoalteromonas sp. JW3]OHU90169.1 hypothetical protein BET10_14530 [Pseudoalteromonas amylolytica]
MISEQQWQSAKSVCKASLFSSLHYAIASVDENGSPHLTPIGSLMLGTLTNGQAQACYFERFTKQLPSNAKHNTNVCILAVNSSKWFWFQSLLKGQFLHQPAVRLAGQLGPLRLATDEEIQRWQRRVRLLRFTKGHRLMWQSMRHVRDITITEVKAVNIGKMTR